jgi:hypothetical protein
MEAIDKTAEADGKVIEFYPGQKFSPDQPDLKFDHRLCQLESGLERIKLSGK